MNNTKDNKFFKSSDHFKTIFIFLGIEDTLFFFYLNKRMYHFIIPRKILKEESLLMNLKQLGLCQIKNRLDIKYWNK